jgi:hypothetical protein
MSSSDHYVFLCNDPPIKRIPQGNILSYTGDSSNKNINLELPKFISSVFHLSDRILDLLELAAYLFAADRMSNRGAKEAVEYHNWSRSFEFHMRVRDFDFWANSSTQFY